VIAVDVAHADAVNLDIVVYVIAQTFQSAASIAVYKYPLVMRILSVDILTTIDIFSTLW
jgi:hypothetical protein